MSLTQKHIEDLLKNAIPTDNEHTFFVAFFFLHFYIYTSILYQLQKNKQIQT